MSTNNSIENSNKSLKKAKNHKATQTKKSNNNNNNNNNNNMTSSSKNTSKDLTEKNQIHIHNDNSSSEEETCLICAENIKIASLSPCNHKVCHLCSFRNIALYKKNQCLVCRTEVPHFIFTENLAFDKFDEITESQLIPEAKGDYGVRFTSEYAKEETLKLLEYSCPIKSCSFHGRIFNSFKELNNHVKDVHDKYYCELCAKFKKAFISELKLYGRKQLHVHQTKGDDIGFKGHPECKFCTNKRFYSDDELYVHMRDHHERCHICYQIDPNNPQYFRNYDHLAQHFRSAHYICTVPSCLEQKFVVFQDEFDLQTHMAKEHPALCGGNNILMSTNTFNNQLYTVSNNKKKSKVTSNNNSRSDNYELKKKRLEERAKHYLNYSQINFDKFLAVNIEYSNGSISANQVIDKYHDIFKDSKDVDYDLLVYELSGLFPSKSELRKNLEAINKPQLEIRELKENFPALSGTTTFMQPSFWGETNITKSSSKLKITSDRSTTLDSSYMPSLPVDNTPIFNSGSRSDTWITSTKMSKSSSNIKTRGVSSNPSPVNGYSIPGYNPISVSTGKSKTKNPWNSTKSASNINSKSNLASSSFPSLASVSSASSSSSSSSLNSSHSKINTSLSATLKNPSRTISYTPTQTISKPLDESLFPSLPKLEPKKVIARVNPINSDSSVWGGSRSTMNGNTNHTSSSDAFDLNIIGTSVKTVKGKKGKKIVYQIGL